MTVDQFVHALRAEQTPLEDAPGSLAAYETDFGRLVRGASRGVVRARSVDEMARIVRMARSLGVKLTPRGAGLSQGGQSVAAETITLDLSDLRSLDVSALRDARVSVGPGTTFREILAETIPHGLTLPVVPLNLDLTVGGVLSAGGMGSSTHRHGLVVDHVVSANVVLGTGEQVTFSRESEVEVRDVVLGGVGRAGILACITLALVPTPRALRSLVLLYRDLSTLLADQTRLALRAEVEHLDAMCAPAMLGLIRTPQGGRAPLRRFSYALHLTVGADAVVEPLLADLSHDEVLHDEADDPLSFASRFDARFAAMRATGAWELAHPWFEAFVPAARAREALERAMAMPPFLSELVRATPVASDARGARSRSVAMPEGPAFVVAMLPAGVPAAFVEQARGAIEALDAAYASLGAKRYLSGWLPRIHALGWAEHHGASLDALARVVERCDPDHVLASRLPPLPR
ncbi:MAG: FAD-binding oxidoreductase [Deltaproteobacteria bacterium]|nr:FAD-binding oxidoreductase [Deltaproteobacteria bacterium]